MVKCNCVNCNKKLKLTDIEMKCKCGKTFCYKHRNPEEHNCKYNFEVENKSSIIDEMKIVSKKISVI